VIASSPQRLIGGAYCSLVARKPMRHFGMARFLLPNTERGHTSVASRTRGVEQASAIELMLRAFLEEKALR
jgi:hypothetical protein